eukprot:gene4351-biopygen12551
MLHLIDWGPSIPSDLEQMLPDHLSDQPPLWTVIIHRFEHRKEHNAEHSSSDLDIFQEFLDQVNYMQMLWMIPVDEVVAAHVQNEGVSTQKIP